MSDEKINNIHTYYSPYGYVEVNKDEFSNDNMLIAFKKNANLLIGSINKSELKENIIVNLKTFYGDRKTLNFDFNINEKLSELINKLCIEEDILYKDLTGKVKWNFSNQYRLFSTIGRIRELNPCKTFKDHFIKNHETIIMLPNGNIFFSENKGNLIFLEDRNKTAFKQGGDDNQYVLSEQGYNIGKNYCEFILDTEPYEKSVIIGVSLKRTDFNYNPNDLKGFWGFVLSDCKKIFNNTQNKVEQIEYGDICKIGDRIGIMMEFNELGLDISFYINKINMGIAYKSLQYNTYYPCAILGFDGTKVRITNKVEYPDL